MATTTRRSGGSNVALTTRKRRSGGAWVDLTIAKRRSGGVWVNLFEHSVSCTNVVDTSEPNGAAGAKFSTASVSNGIGPFTYAWSWQSGGTGIVLSNTTTSTVQLDSTGTDQVRSGTLLCQVTDTGNGNLVKSGTATVSITHGTPP